MARLTYEKTIFISHSSNKSKHSSRCSQYTKEIETIWIGPIAKEVIDEVIDRKRRKKKNGEQRSLKWKRKMPNNMKCWKTRNGMNTPCLEKEKHSINYVAWGLVRFHFLMILEQNEVLELGIGKMGERAKENISKFLYIGHKIKCLVYICSI